MRLVQFRSSKQRQKEFYATFKRGLTNGTVRALIAAVLIYMNGKCSGSIRGREGERQCRGDDIKGGFQVVAIMSSVEWDTSCITIC